MIEVQQFIELINQKMNIENKICIHDYRNSEYDYVIRHECDNRVHNPWNNKYIIIRKVKYVFMITEIVNTIMSLDMNVIIVSTIPEIIIILRDKFDNFILFKSNTYK